MSDATTAPGNSAEASGDVLHAQCTWSEASARGVAGSRGGGMHKRFVVPQRSPALRRLIRFTSRGSLGCSERDSSYRGLVSLVVR